MDAVWFPSPVRDLHGWPVGAPRPRGARVTTGRIASHNDLTVPAGSYVLSVPELGLHEVCPLQR